MALSSSDFMSPTGLSRERNTQNAHVHKIMCRRQGSGGEGHLWVCICKASLAKACANIRATMLPFYSPKWPISSHQDGIWGCRPKVFRRNWSKGAIEDDRTCCMCVCVCVSLPLIQYSSCFSVDFFLNPCVNPNIYKQYVFQTKLPGLFGVNFLFLFHQRMWTSFCLVIWYPLVMIFFKVDLNILLFACEASWNLWKPLCFWCDIPTLTPWLRITVIWYCYTVDIPLRSSSWLSGSC